MRRALALLALLACAWAGPARAQMLPEGDCAGVYWDLTAAFASGDRVHARVLVTRAGPGTKIICLGNIAQIDTPYLTEGSSGLTYVVDRFKGWAHSGHVTLARGERSRLADRASEVL